MLVLSEWFKELALSFVPLFFAIDAVGIVPLYLSITGDLHAEQSKALLRDAVLAAFIVSAVFMFSGKLIFQMMGITADDFRIGGGIILLLIAIMDLLFSNRNERRNPGDIGVVPIGIPLIVGPAVLTTTMMSADKHGYFVTLMSLIVNLAIVWMIFANSKYLLRVIGKGGAKAFGKVAAMFLAAIAVMMIRVGISNIVEGRL